MQVIVCHWGVPSLWLNDVKFFSQRFIFAFTVCVTIQSVSKKTKFKFNSNSKSKPDYFRLVALQEIMNQISLLTANPISVLLLRTIHYVFREIHDWYLVLVSCINNSTWIRSKYVGVTIWSILIENMIFRLLPIG